MSEFDKGTFDANQYIGDWKDVGFLFIGRSQEYIDGFNYGIDKLEDYWQL